MKGGHNRVPEELKRLRGTVQPCRSNPAAPKVTPGKVPPPPARWGDAERETWFELARQVEDLGTYSDSNLTAFRLMVRAVVAAEDPEPIAPSARARLISSANTSLASFGLTPASRGKVSAAGKREADTAADFLFADRMPGPGGDA